MSQDIKNHVTSEVDKAVAQLKKSQWLPFAVVGAVAVIGILYNWLA